MLASAALRWPAPALLSWALAWLAYVAVIRAGGAPWTAWLLAMLPACACAWRQSAGWRRAWLLGGFPLSWLLIAAARGWPAWTWLVPLALLLAAYPLRAWRDAPYFPSPADALMALRDELKLGPSPRLLDAGCGLGHGLLALRKAWPQARIEGVEWSWPLALAARLRCGFARVRRGDLWAGDWAGFDLVYLFQRPESMARAHAKAAAQMKPGAWLVSLEFEVPGVPPDITRRLEGGKPVHAWCIVHGPPPQPPLTGADKTPRSGGFRRACP